MPVLLSLVGPLNTDVGHEEEEENKVSPKTSEQDKEEKGEKKEV